MSRIITIGCLGPEGSFSHEAAVEARRRGRQSLIVFFNTNEMVLEALEANMVDAIVIAIHTALGPVEAHIQKLEKLGAKRIDELIDIEVRFHLAGRKPVFETQDTVIVQAPNSYNQCNKWIDEHSNFEFIKCSSNSEAAHMAGASIPDEVCCITNEVSANICGLTIYERDLQGSANITTFGVYHKSV